MDTAITASRDIRVFLSSTFADMYGAQNEALLEVSGVIL